jgi:NAD(P)H-flavin reductase
MEKPVIPQEYEVEVVSKKELYPGVVHVQIKKPAGLTFRPGQYASFLVPNGRRPFSFVSLPTDNFIDFLIGYTPTGLTRPLVEPLQVGQSFRLLAPYGRFIVNTQDENPLIFIAGGTGIAPIYSQLQYLLPTTSKPVTLFFANYDEARLYFDEEFKQLANQYKNFTYIPCLSKPTPDWHGHIGLVTQLVPQLVSNMAAHTFYVCGSPGLVTDMLTVIKNNQVPDTQIHFERFT